MPTMTDTTDKARQELKALTAEILQDDRAAKRKREKRKKRVQHFYDRGVSLSTMADACGMRESALRRDVTTRRMAAHQ